MKDRGPGGYGDPSMELEASRLMMAVKTGDRNAFDVLVAGLRGRAFHVARGMVGSREDALELSQEAFLKVFRARATFRDGEPFLPWFHRILRNTCYSWMRQRGRVRESSLSAHAPGLDADATDWEIADEARGPEGEAQAGERRGQFWSAWRALSARDREILSLRHFQDLSYREIAGSLGVPEGTVMSRLFHARRRLREALGEAFLDACADGLELDPTAVRARPPGGRA